MQESALLFINCRQVFQLAQTAIQAELICLDSLAGVEETVRRLNEKSTLVLVIDPALESLEIEELCERLQMKFHVVHVIMASNPLDPALTASLVNLGVLRGLFVEPYQPSEILQICQRILHDDQDQRSGEKFENNARSTVSMQKEIQLRTMIQEQLQTEKELLSTTLMSIGEGVIVTDEETHIVLINRAAEILTGFEALEAVDAPLASVFRLCDSATLRPYTDIIQALFLNDVTEISSPNYHQPTLLTKTGERILVSGKITPRKSEFDHTYGYVIVFEDITEKQKFAAQTALSQKMEAIGQLAAGIAHEINTPIQYIGDNLRFLNKAFSRYAETLSIIQQMAAGHLEQQLTMEDLQTMEEIIHSNKIARYTTEVPNAVNEALDGIDRVRKIVLAMREFSHPTEHEKKPADINHGIETTITISRNEWKYCADMETDLDPDLPLVECQIDEINQVVLNMIVNGAQAIQEKNRAVPKEKGKIRITTRTSAEHVIIEISDSGAGIPESIRDRIFDPFFTTKGVGRGTGQGLSVARNIIVNKHQGQINVESQPSLGTTFTIKLPIGLYQGGFDEPA